MWIYRSLLAVAGGSCLVFLSATLTRTAASVGPASTVPSAAHEAYAVAAAPAAYADPAAERCFDQALDAFNAERVAWLEMDIWQKVQMPGCVYEADGFYRLAPGQRFRLELHTRLKEGEATMLSVSDGQEVWQAERAGHGTWENVTRVHLSEVFAAMNGPAGPRLREEFLQRPHFQGMMPLLRDLRCRLVWARNETIHQEGADFVRLIGVWPMQEALLHAAPDQPWPNGLPRQCHLYLDARNSWPVRIEWWGPSTTGGADRLLAEMEFRNPVFNRPLPPQTCARLFAFHPGTIDVDDQTTAIATEVSRRAGELTQPNAAR